MSPLKVFDIPSRIFDVIEGALIAQSAIVEQLMMMVISKMAQAASFGVNPRKPYQLALLLCLTCHRTELHIIIYENPTTQLQSDYM